MFTSSSLLSLLVLACRCQATDYKATFESRTYFYAGGNYVNTTSPAFGPGRVYVNQIYVEKLVPQHPSQPYPLVFIPGAGQTGTNFLNTPDGREGWASYFLKKGYTVYLTDPPQRGRSPFLPGSGVEVAVPAEVVEKYFTASEKFPPFEWPQASLHTQFPGTGVVGDKIFDAFYASQVQLQADAVISESNSKAAYSALLDRIGEAVFVTHSQSGPYGWLVADARPKLVKGIVAIEPEGPPFVNESGPTGPPRVDGLTRLPMTYDPPVKNAITDIKTVTIPPPPGKNYTSCTLFADPAPKLVNLAKIPVVLITGEASFHAPYDYCFQKFFTQTGVPYTWLDLGQLALHGNGHFSFLEKNSDKVADLVYDWLKKNIKSKA